MAKLVLLLQILFFVSFTNGFSNVYRKVKYYPCSKEDTGSPLFLTPLIDNNQIDEARNKALVQHKEMNDVSSYAGYLTVNKEYNSNLFFWFFPAVHNPRTAPVLLWLQGGPGVTSLFSLFLENGPFTITRNKTLDMRKYSWSNCHNMLYIDNPVGTGFSFTEDEKGYATNETHVGRDVYSALIQFFKLFSELQSNDFYVTGESYAGKYVPAVSYTIKENNAKADVKINLKGLAIGNGLTDPVNQLQYGDFLYQLGLIDVNGRDLFRQYEERGRALIKQRKFDEAFIVFDELLNGDLTKQPSLFHNLTGFDYYFNILRNQVDNDAENDMVQWLQRADVRKAIHVGNYTFLAVSTKVEEYLKGDIMESVANLIADLVQRYKVLIYNGQLDVIIAYTTVENYLRNLNWPLAEEYKKAQRKIWYVGDELAGYSKTVGNLIEVLVRNAGHTVPSDQPKWALDLITRFTRNKKF